LNKRKNVNIVIADKINEAGLKLFKNNFNVTEKYGIKNDILLRYLSKKNNLTESALIVRSTRKINKNLLKQFSEHTNVKLICSVSSGFDNIDVEAANLYKIKVLNVPWGNYVSAAEHTFSLILAVNKQLSFVDSQMKKKKFITGYNISEEITGKSIGIIGVGRIGSRVAAFARSFGMKIYGNDIKQAVINKYKWIKFLPLNRLLKTCDIITVHTPLDKSTRDLINRTNIKFLKPHAIIINCARGGIINEYALYDSLKRKKINFAGIDVFENEPEINFRFADLDNVLLTPHIAGKTKQSHVRMSIQAAEQIINYYK
jgi:D-3-phosphoglycerate dehydrogenase / 2-oxoglutarate reductase